MTQNHWKIDKHIPIALIVALCAQVASVLIWATELDARVGNVEKQASENRGFNEKFARIEERLDYMKQDTNAIRRQLEILVQKLVGK